MNRDPKITEAINHMNFHAVFYPTEKAWNTIYNYILQLESFKEGVLAERTNNEQD